MTQHYFTAKLFRVVRARRKLSLRAFADLMNIHHSTLHRYEKELKGPSSERLDRLVELSHFRTLDELWADVFPEQ